MGGGLLEILPAVAGDHLEAAEGGDVLVRRGGFVEAGEPLGELPEMPRRHIVSLQPALERRLVGQAARIFTAHSTASPSPSKYRRPSRSTTGTTAR